MTSYTEEIKQRSKENLATHQMTVLQDDGLRRHLHFQREDGRFVYSFDLVTWPGYLCITGDMGCYVFTRIDDMFEFFRNDSCGINPNYWAEKITSPTRNCWSEFDPEAFEQSVKEVFEKWEFESDDEKEAVWTQIESEVLCQEDTDVYQSIQCFNSDYTDHEFDSDFFMDYGPWRRSTLSYLLCLHAIVYGINEYDKFKSDHPRESLIEMMNVPKIESEFFDAYCAAINAAVIAHIEESPNCEREVARYAMANAEFPAHYVCTNCNKTIISIGIKS